MTTYLIQLLFGATLLLLVAIASNALLYKAAASLRYRVWTFTLLGLLLLPVLSPLLPTTHLPLTIPAPQYHEAGFVSPPLPLGEGWGEGVLYSTHVSNNPHPPYPINMALPEGEGILINSFSGGEGMAERQQNTGAVAPVQHAQSNTPIAIRYDAILLAIWLIGTTVLLLHLVMSIRSVRRMVASLESVTDPTLDELRREFGIKRAIRLMCGVPLNCNEQTSPFVSFVKSLCPLWLKKNLPQSTQRAHKEHKEILVPFITGIFNPTIVLPPQAQHWSASERRAVLTHELAHVVRGDLFWQLVTQIVCALYWFHPLVWFAAYRIWVERESACDDTVVLRGEKPSMYADLLLELANGLRRQRIGMLGCTVAMTRKNKVAERIKAILNPNLRRLSLGRVGTAVFLCVAIATIVLTATISPVAQPPRETATASPDGAAQNPGTTATPSSPALSDVAQNVGVPFTFTGSVIANDADKTPIKDATVLVQFWDGPDFTNNQGPAPPEKCFAEVLVKTDDAGKYAVALPEKLIGTPNLHIKVMTAHPDYISRGFHSHSIDEAIERQRFAQYGDFTLEPAAHVTGTVLSPNGRPVAGAFVRAFSWQSPNKGLGDAFFAATDEQGRFNVKTYSAHPENGLLLWVLTKDYAPILKEFDRLPTNAGTIRLEAGVPVKGRLLDREGKPLAGVWINVTEKESPAPFPQHKIWRSALTNANGEFETTPLAPGNYVQEPTFSPMDPLVIFDGRRYADMAMEGINTLEDRKLDGVPSYIANFRKLQDVYLQQNISLPAAGNAPLEVRPAELALIRFRVTDSTGQPYTEPLLVSVTGKINDALWQGLDESFKTNAQGYGGFLVPYGLEHVIFVCRPAQSYRSHPTRFRLGNHAPKTDWCFEFAKIDRSVALLNIQVLKPTFLRVAVVDEQGKAFEFHPVVRIEYANKNLFEDNDSGGFGFIQGFGRADIDHTDQQAEGDVLLTWQSIPVLPGEEFTASVSRRGYESTSETLTLAEGETKTMKFVLKSTAP